MKYPVVGKKGVLVLMARRRDVAKGARLLVVPRPQNMRIWLSTMSRSSKHLLPV
jgi:hypothetical protein